MLLSFFDVERVSPRVLRARSVGIDDGIVGFKFIRLLSSSFTQRRFVLFPFRVVLHDRGPLLLFVLFVVFVFLLSSSSVFFVRRVVHDLDFSSLDSLSKMHEILFSLERMKNFFFWSSAIFSRERAVIYISVFLLNSYSFFLRLISSVFDHHRL